MTQPEDPQQPAQPSAEPAAPQPESTGGVPLPPGWGQQQPAPQQPITPVYQPQDGQPVYQPPQDPFHTTTMTPAGVPTSGAPGPYGDPQTQAYPPFQAVEQPPKKRNKALIITAVVLGVVLLLCAAGGVGAFFLLRDTEGKGAASAEDAAQDFLTAVYKDGDVTSAEKLVCGEARDREALAAKIKEVEAQLAGLRDPSITWNNPKISNETAERAETTVTVKLTTSDEKLSEQKLKLILVKRDGWFVCEVKEQKS